LAIVRCCRISNLPSFQTRSEASLSMSWRLTTLWLHSTVCVTNDIWVLPSGVFPLQNTKSGSTPTKQPSFISQGRVGQALYVVNLLSNMSLVGSGKTILA
jgi:hypothetical protein